MASGIKGASKPSGGAPNYGSTALVTATATTTLILSICNQSAAADTVRIAVVPASVSATSGAIATEYYIEYDFSLGANTAYERTGLTLESGARLIVGSGAGSLSFVAYGLES
tara:strand:+ start:22797 stop:23132 length:336 start_codon:yes stop_codon:yes gene_type:complete